MRNMLIYHHGFSPVYTKLPEHQNGCLFFNQEWMDRDKDHQVLAREYLAALNGRKQTGRIVQDKHSDFNPLLRGSELRSARARVV